MNEFTLFKFKSATVNAQSMLYCPTRGQYCKCITGCRWSWVKPLNQILIYFWQLTKLNFINVDSMTMLRACFEGRRNVMFTSGWMLIWCWQLTFQVMFSMFNKLLICLCLADLLFLGSNIAVSPVAMQVSWTVSIKTLLLEFRAYSRASNEGPHEGS